MGRTWMIVPLLPLLAVAMFASVVIGLVAAVLSLDLRAGAQRPEVPVQLAAAVGLAGLGFLLGALLMGLSLLLGAAAIYYFVDRRNKHFRRQQILATSLASFLNQELPASETRQIEPLNMAIDESIYNENERPAIIWALVFGSLTPLLAGLTGYFLTDDLQGHQHRQSVMFSHLSRALGSLGIEVPVEMRNVPERDKLLYFVLTLITGGLFWIYWFYTLLKDYNNHFRAQWQIEDRLLLDLRTKFSLPGKSLERCTSCGAEIPVGAIYCPSCGRKRI